MRRVRLRVVQRALPPQEPALKGGEGLGSARDCIHCPSQRIHRVRKAGVVCGEGRKSACGTFRTRCGGCVKTADRKRLSVVVCVCVWSTKFDHNTRCTYLHTLRYSVRDGMRNGRGDWTEHPVSAEAISEAWTPRWTDRTMLRTAATMASSHHAPPSTAWTPEGKRTTSFAKHGDH